MRCLQIFISFQSLNKAVFLISELTESQDIGNADPSENSSNIEVQVFQVAQTPSVKTVNYAEGSVASSHQMTLEPVG